MPQSQLTLFPFYLPTGNPQLSISVSLFFFVYSLILFLRSHIKVILYSISLYLTYFTQHNTPQDHPHCCKWENCILFLWLSSIPWGVCVCMCTHKHCIFIIHSSVVANIGCFLILAIMNHATMDIGVCVYLIELLLSFFFLSYIPRNGTAESYSSSIFTFLRNPYSVFQRGCTNLHFHQQYKGSFSSTFLPTFVIWSF